MGSLSVLRNCNARALGFTSALTKMLLILGSYLVMTGAIGKMSAPTFPVLTTPGVSVFSIYEATSIALADGASVSSWSDSSGGGGPTLSGVGGTEPTYYSGRYPGNWPNGRPQLLFSESAVQHLKGISAADWKFLSDGTPYAIFAVWRPTAANRAARVFLDTTAGASSNVGMSFLWYDTGDSFQGKVEWFIYRGVSQSVSIEIVSTAQILSYNSIHCVSVNFDGTNATMYDWGTSIGTASQTAAPSVANPTAPLWIGAEADSALGFQGDIEAVVIVKGAALNAADLAAINAYLEAKWWPTGDAVWEGCMDTAAVYSQSGVTQGVTPATKYSGNPFLDTLPGNVDSATWDYNKYYPNVIKFGPTDWRMWHGVVNSSGNRAGECYATSSDGVNWTKPNLGQVGANNLIFQYDAVNWFYGTSCTYFPNGLPGKKFVLAIDDPTSSSVGIFLYSNDNDTGYTGNWTNCATLNNSGSQEPTGPIMTRNDGRLQLFYTSGAGGLNNRSIGFFTSATSDPASAWTDYGHVFNSPSTSDQFGGDIFITNHYGTWIAMVGRLNQTDNTTQTFPNGSQWYDIWISRDEGITWTLCFANWLALGGSGGTGSFDCFWIVCGGNLVPDSHVPPTNWIQYYSGGQAGNIVYPGQLAIQKQQIGYATVPYERIGYFTGTGTIVFKAVHQPGQQLTVNANASGGSITVACLDASGNAIAGYGDAQSTVVAFDSPGVAVRWNGQNMPAQTMRLRFTLTNATLYSWLIETPRTFYRSSFRRRAS